MRRDLHVLLLAAVLSLAGGAAQADYLVGSGTSATAPLPAGSCLYVAQFVSAGVFMDRDLCGSFATALGINPQAPAGSNGDIQLRASATALSGLTPGSGITTFLATPTSANLLGALTDETGTGAAVFATSPTLVTPILGTPTSGTLTNATGLPIATGVSGLGTGIATWLATPTAANLQSATTLPAPIQFAMSDETTAITTGTAKITFRMPYAMTLTEVRASLSTASSSGLVTVNIKKGGTTIFSTKVTIDANEKTSVTAATAAVLSTTALADDDEITGDIDGAGTGAAGLKIVFKGTR